MGIALWGGRTTATAAGSIAGAQVGYRMGSRLFFDGLRTSPDFQQLTRQRAQQMFDNLGGQVAAVKSGRVRALGITTLKRSAQLPEVPTIAESGLPGFEVMVWYGMCAPAAVPEPVLAKLNADVLKALATSDLQQRLTEQGVDAAPMTRQAFTGFIKSETAKWAKAVKDSGATAE